MTRNLCRVLGLTFLACVLPACERVQETGPKGPPSLNFRETTDAVPLAYGHLVGVSPAGQNPATVSLWFEADDRTLTAVRVNASTGAISQEVIKVPRK